MANFLICTRYKRNDSYYPVFIRVTHNYKIQYINTGYLVKDNGVRKLYNEKGTPVIEITDPRVLKSCTDLIEQFVAKINGIRNVNLMSCKDLVKFLESKNDNVSFTEYAWEYVRKKKEAGRPDRNDRTMINNIHKFFNKQNILFDELTTKNVQLWMDSLSGTKRAKSHYPARLRAILNAAIRELNDYDYGIIRVHVDPFRQLKIPREDLPDKRSIDIDLLRMFLTAKPVEDFYRRQELALDVSMLIFCLAGINAADLYDMPSSALSRDWKLCYHRKKTRDQTVSKAYTEIIVPPIIRPLFHKYEDDERLFNFHRRYSQPLEFTRNVNKGCKGICEHLGIKKISTYVLRHSWATIAFNNCGASMEAIALALVHSTQHRITERYIRPDFGAVTKLNNQVIDVVFGGESGSAYLTTGLTG